MPDDKKQPQKVKREDYAWCTECDGFVLKKLLRRNEGIFTDDGELQCPEGHTIVEVKPDGDK